MLQLINSWIITNGWLVIFFPTITWLMGWYFRMMSVLFNRLTQEQHQNKFYNAIQIIKRIQKIAVIAGISAFGLVVILIFVTEIFK